MFGKDYVFQHIIQTIKQEQKELLYRVYVTDTLRCISMGIGKYPEKRFAELLNPQSEETRTPEEIIENIRSKLAQS